MTPAGIEPATFQFVAQRLNHCATAVHRPPSSNWSNECVELHLHRHMSSWRHNQAQCHSPNPEVRRNNERKILPTSQWTQSASITKGNRSVSFGDKITVNYIMFSFGYFPGVSILYVDVSEHSICSIFIGRCLPMKMEQIVFRNVGIYNSYAGELPKRKHNIFRTRRKFGIKNRC